MGGVSLMIKLIEYFNNNCIDGYYAHHFKYISLGKDEVCFFDDKEVISEFKKMIQPGFENEVYLKENEFFVMLCFYLYNEGYTIAEFPDFLSRPNPKCALYDFGCTQIKMYLRGKCNLIGKVPLEARRNLIDNLKFGKNEYKVTEDVNLMIQEISTRSAKFEEMAIDEKLKVLCNTIEFLLKDNGTYGNVDYDDCFDYLNDSIIKSYRKRLNCFRHGSKESLEERNTYSDFQKVLLVRYGIFIVEVLYKKINS